MKILVIGNGLIGSSIIQRLKAEGHSLLVFSRRMEPHCNYETVTGDIFDFEIFQKVLEWKPQIVIHTAWITSPETYKTDPLNLDYKKFTIQLAKSILDSEVSHLIILGSCSEYGHQVHASTAGHTLTSPNNFYSSQKIESFEAVKLILLNSQVRLTWARIFFPYGPKQSSEKLVPAIINCLSQGKSIRLKDTTSILDWISTRDIASAISWVIANTLPTEVDIGTTVGYTNLELLVVLEKLMHGDCELHLREAHESGRNEVCVMGTKSPLILSGWQPQDSLQSGFEWILGL